ncbi:MAG: hypothetical protein EON54_26325 [Alcaligenaceae bacterium]|nr:MAG: hypothetical protein EON54_26325 [Alcaligenaceae bacterium]
MKLLLPFNRKAEKVLAYELSQHLIKNIPAKLMSERRQVLSASRISRLLEQVFDRAQNNAHGVGNGFFSRTFLANSFKWELREAGYPDEFINIAVEGLLMKLSRPKV